MTDVSFYHLTTAMAEQALPQLLEKTLEAGKKAVVSSESSSLTPLSSALWLYGHSNGGGAHGRRGSIPDSEGSWLAHGIAGQDDEDAELCPIWFRADRNDNPINADYAFYLDGTAPEEVDKFERVFILFNGRDDDAVVKARQHWKSLQDADHQLSYWTQDGSGGWQKTK